jgi:hypothetical protein
LRGRKATPWLLSPVVGGSRVLRDATRCTPVAKDTGEGDFRIETTLTLTLSLGQQGRGDCSVNGIVNFVASNYDNRYFHVVPFDKSRRFYGAGEKSNGVALRPQGKGVGGLFE